MPGGLQSPIFSCHKLKCFGSDVCVHLLSHLSVVWHPNSSFFFCSESEANLVEELMNNTAMCKRNLVHIRGIRYDNACWFTAKKLYKGFLSILMTRCISSHAWSHKRKKKNARGVQPLKQSLKTTPSLVQSVWSWVCQNTRLPASVNESESSTQGSEYLLRKLLKNCCSQSLHLKKRCIKETQWALR